MKIKVIAFIGLMLLTGCTDNFRTKQLGGTMTIDLPQNTKLINVTWKEGNNLWILTRQMKDNDTIDSYEFNESSSFGIIQGKIILCETK